MNEDFECFEKTPLLDQGYVQLIETWGSDERIIEAARMSTGKGFNGWGTSEIPGDEKLLAYLYNNKHSTPFEMAGMIIEVKAPIFVYREWHRHRTQCLAPDTMLHFDTSPNSKSGRNTKLYKMTIQDAWRKFNPPTRKNEPSKNSKQAEANLFHKRELVKQMRLRCLNEDTGEIIHTNILDVIKGEPKQMFRVTTASGKQIVATKEHKFYTSEGWTSLGDAIERSLLLTVEGTARGKAMRWEFPEPDVSKEEWRDIKGYENYLVSSEGRVKRIGCSPKKPSIGANGYDVVSLSKNGKTSVFHVHSLVLRHFEGEKLPDQESRHMDGNRADNRHRNLQWGSSKENGQDRVDLDRNQRLVSNLEEIIDVEDMGIQDSYDLVVPDPWHNFVANGFIVHNSYNEMSARYIPLPDENYVPTIERLMLNQSTGTTNKQAQSTGAELCVESAIEWQEDLVALYAQAEALYKRGIALGIPKELARVPVPVARYSRMRASANLRNWLQFLTLRMNPAAQWEIREYANAVGMLIKQQFPQTWKLFALEQKIK